MLDTGTVVVDPDELCGMIERHEHDLMLFEAHGARLLATPRAREALQWCAANAPDEACRHSASKNLAKL